MTDFDALLDEAEAEPVPSRVVKVCVKPAVAVKRAALLQAIDVARKDDAAEMESDKRLGAPGEVIDRRQKAARAELDAFEDEAKKALVTIRFTRMEGAKWARLTSAHPMRIDVPLDRQYGYDYDTVSELAARATGIRLDDDGEHEITDQQWNRLLPRLSGHDVEQIREAVFILNEWGPSQHIEALVKGSGAA
jgi:hypothetical protein